MFKVPQHAEFLEFLGVGDGGEDDLLFGRVQHLLDEVDDEVEDAGVVPRAERDEVDQSQDIVQDDETVAASLCILEDPHNFIHYLSLV
jgi:hypothetical protein